MRDLVLLTPPPNWVKVEVRLLSSISTLVQRGPTKSCYTLGNRHTLWLSRPPSTVGHSQHANHDRDTAPKRVKCPVPFIVSTFSHACPTRATGDQSRMQFVLGTVPSVVRRKNDASEPDWPGCASFPTEYLPDTPLVAERVFDEDPSLYLLSLQQITENDYPIPSYTADVFDKPDSWVDTPQPVSESILLLPHKQQCSRAYAIDDEMVCSHFYTTSPASLCTTSLSTTQTHDRLPHNVALPFSSHVRTPPII